MGHPVLSVPFAKFTVARGTVNRFLPLVQALNQFPAVRVECDDACCVQGSSPSWTGGCRHISAGDACHLSLTHELLILWLERSVHFREISRILGMANEGEQALGSIRNL